MHFCSAFYQDTEELTLQINDGKILGRYMTSESGRTISAFMVVNYNNLYEDFYISIKRGFFINGKRYIINNIIFLFRASHLLVHLLAIYALRLHEKPLPGM